VVVANHALTMVEASRATAMADADPEGGRAGPTRYVFDEGHHIFDAADSFFAVHITGWEGAEMRRWLRGAEGRGARRSRGLIERLTPVLENDPEESYDAALDNPAVVAKIRTRINEMLQTFPEMKSAKT